MTKRELILNCNEAIGVGRVPNVTILAIWAVTSTHYEIYQDHFKNFPAKHELKVHQGVWGKELKRFNHQLYRQLPENLACDLLEEVFDDYMAMMRNHIVRLKLAVMKQVKTDDLEVRKRFSDAYVCYELAVIMQTLFGIGFGMMTDGGGRKVKSIVLERLESSIRKWFLEYLKVQRVDIPLRTKEVEQEEQTLARESVRWIKKINEEIQDED